jgi:hypothetical protein
MLSCMAKPAPLIVDTSTLLNLDLRSISWSSSRYEKPLMPSAIEALVLFENVLLDGPTVELHAQDLGWLRDIDHGIEILRIERPKLESLYLRAASLFRELEWDRLHWDSYSWDEERGGDFAIEASWLEQRISEQELRYEFPRRMSFQEWRTVAEYLSTSVSADVAESFTQGLGRSAHSQINKIVGLVRLFYYLALQEAYGGSLLVHPARAFAGLGSQFSQPSAPMPISTLGNQILGRFGESVQKSYLDRRRRWLGAIDADISFQTPSLAQFVAGRGKEKGWSIGRTISWLREQPEVSQFRAGLTALAGYLEESQHEAVNEVLAELEDACARWCHSLKQPARPARRFSLQVALPFVQPAFDVGVPLPARTPAQRLLVFVGWVLRESVNEPPAQPAD